ncbi:MAG: hypothetical protein LBN97_02905 [Oscillospiraceae bacterium]|jgi:hypothetical protein|nr:hypothetical protein [Oscillospiraceae bacterium]
MFNTELRKIFHGGRLLLFIACICALTFYGDMREGSMRFGLQTATEMIDTFLYPQYPLPSVHLPIAIDAIAKKWDLDAADLHKRITSFYDLSNEIQAPQFEHLAKPTLGFFIMAVFFAPYYIGMDFKARAFNSSLYSGHTRSGVYFTKIAMYFALCAFMSIFATFALIIAYSASSFGTVPAGALLSLFAERLLIDLAIMSVPLALVFAFRAVIYPALITFGLCALIWLMNYSAGLVLSVWSIIVLPLMVAAGWLFFRKADLA